MQFIEITDYDHETMQLARPVYDRMRRVLLASGRTIHPKLIERIKELGISTLMVEDADTQGITMDEMLDMPTWLDAIEVVQKVYENVRMKQPIPLIDLQQTASKMIHEVTQRKTIFLIPSSFVADELKEYAHVVNVALLSIQTGKTLQYAPSKLKELAIGALLHDIGKALTNVTAEHPQKGFEFIKSIREVSLLSAHIAYQHHELLNGQGYPRQIAGKEILEYPQICAVANVYERLLSQEKVLPHEALEMLMTKYETEYSGNVISAFLTSVPSYIPGTKVRLSNGKDAVVTGIKSDLHRPLIKYLDNQQEIHLADHPSIMISGLIESNVKEKVS
ncbi:HD-GYP domain-containing protein [Metabacillus malikii]|uniref:HD-GYP domain-containing protein (C-di-GMP phosphodiesterase class II) n=1 Tax=Metabacillus malikii TaxID=1504265 RepID=A0ABT9ZPW3_9BACI|nr:HD domain-containing phosphohydrolase [Metabacillus malikii]MDQ0233553.1 HD-GYP domain-containing protein (c-di-GMP phosphodiesterase class II) [Metabacillus malikii]